MKNRAIKGLFIGLLVGLVSWACPVLGQAKPKKPLAGPDYRLWSRMEPGALSGDGKWISWRVAYEEGIDTVFVRKTTGGRTFSFANAGAGKFAGNGYFGVVDANGLFTLQDLAKGGSWSHKDVKEFCVLPRERMIVLEVGTNLLNELQVYTLNGKPLASVRNVKSWKANLQGTQLAIASHEAGIAGCLLLNLRTLRLDVVATSAGKSFQRPVWQEQGDFFAFVQPGSDIERGKVYIYATKASQLQTFEPSRITGFPDGFKIASTGSLPLRISHDGKRVFFGIGAQQQRESKDSIVQVWQALDKVIYPMQALLDSNPKVWLGMWEPAANRFLQISGADTPGVALSGKEGFALVWDPLAYEPQWKFNGETDYYIVDLGTGEKSKWLEKQDAGSVFPCGITDDIVFRKDKAWLLYDPLKKRTVKLRGLAGENPQKAISGFAPDTTPATDISGKYVILHDGLDIYRIEKTTGASKRLTNGRETGKAFYGLFPESLSERQDYDLSHAPKVDLSAPLLLMARAVDKTATGFFRLYPRGALQRIAYGPMGYDNLLTDASGEILAYTEQTFEQPPKLVAGEPNQFQTVYWSNPHHRKYEWGKAQLLQYGSGDKKGQAVLYAPANVLAGQRYPMVVRVYEKQSDTYLFFQLPTLRSGTGFNVAHLLAHGYFVLLPDVEYEIGDPGGNALQCVNAAVDAALASHPIDPGRLGLMGHSFGGFETAFILTRTNRFAAAVAGAAPTDLVSGYLYAGWNYSRPDFWRFEYGQFRMGTGLFENKAGYLDNSPVLHADKITTPLLLWTGDKDLQVNASQSLELHLALRRLGKQSVLLVYAGEDHVLASRKAQEDLTHKITQWFGHYLKTDVAAE